LKEEHPPHYETDERTKNEELQERRQQGYGEGSGVGA
jgi:hypothetical protein